MTDAGLERAIEELTGELVETLAETIRLPSVNPEYPGETFDEHVGREGDVSRLLGAVYEQAGAELDVFGSVPGRENCVGCVRGVGGGRSLIFNGHVDVVPGGPPEEWTLGGPFEGRVADGLVVGRGACDMKGGLLAQAFAAVALRRAGIQLAGDLILEAVVGEETMQHELGTSACIERGYRADGAVVAEASAPPLPLAVVPATPGVMRFIVHIAGRKAHPAMRGATIHAGGDGWEAGVNAVDKAVHVYQAVRLREEEWALTKRHPLFAPGQFVIHPGVLVASPRGKLDPFTIADTATIDYIVIYHPDESEAEVRAEIEELIADAARLDGWLRAHPPVVEWKHHWPPSVVAAEHPLVVAMGAAHAAASGQPAEVRGWSAVHDGAFLNLAGIPAICYGPGDIRYAHTADEHVRIDELLTATRAYAELAVRWCGVA